MREKNLIPCGWGTEDGCGKVKAREGAQQPRELELEKSGALDVQLRRLESLREASGNISFNMAKIYGNHLRVRVVDSMRKGFIGVGVHWSTISQLGSLTLPSPDARSPRPTGRWGDLVRSGKIWWLCCDRPILGPSNDLFEVAVTQHMQIAS